MAKELLINVSQGEECRIALLEDGRLEELYMERASSSSHVGNIYKGKVTNVEASIQAAFVDFGLGRNGFLHISDLMPKYFGRKGEEIEESVGRKMARRDRPPIQRCLRRGDEIVVQIIKEGIGTKGPTLSTYISIPGRILVMMPGMSKFGVSRKIEDEDERRRLRQILDSLKPIDEVGFIIRTAGIGKAKTEIQRDLTYLTRLWQTIEKKMKTPGPTELYTEGDLVTRTVRDVFSADIDAIIVDDKDVAKRVKDVIKISAPRTKNRVDFYDEPVPLFHKFGIEREIELMYSRHVPLPSGGSLVIDSTEAIVAIDVNSGKFRDHADAETTAFRTDMEAADEITRQLRLRDLGGVIICDFIDLRYERHRRDLEQKLHDNLKNDRAKTKVLRMSQFGIIEMTRQRMRPSYKRTVYYDCPHCKGSGLVKTPESMSLDVMRRLAIAIHDQRIVRVEMTAATEVASYLLNRKRVALAELENETGKQILIRSDISLALDESRLELFDAREGLVFLPDLGMTPGGQDSGRAGRHGHGTGRAHPQQQRGGGPGRGSAAQQGARGGARDQRKLPGPPTPRERDHDEERYEAGDEEFEGAPVGESSGDDEARNGAPSEPPRNQRGGGGRDRGPARGPARGPDRGRGRSQAPPTDDSIDEHADDDVEDPESQVIDVDEANEPMGEGPREMDDHRRRPHGHDRGRPQGQQSHRQPAQARDAQPRDGQPRGAPARVAPARDNRGNDRNAAGANAGNGGGNGGGGNGGGGNGGGNGGPGNGAGGEAGTGRRRRRRGRRGRGGRNRQDAQGGPQQPQLNNDDADHRDHVPSAGERDETFDDRGGSATPQHADYAVEHELDIVDPGADDDRGNRSEAPMSADAPDRESDGGDEAPDGEAHGGEVVEGEVPPGGKRRRRRRGGRRHRRRKAGDVADGADVADVAKLDAPAMQDEDVAPETPPEEEEADEQPATQSRAPRGSAATKSSRRAPQEAPAKEEPAEPATPRKRGGAKRVASSRNTPSRRASAPRTPPRESASKSASAEPPAPVVRTGSTDRHLVEVDEVEDADTPVVADPVHFEPPRRPRSSRDLDAIPDDFEE